SPRSRATPSRRVPTGRHHTTDVMVRTGIAGYFARVLPTVLRPEPPEATATTCAAHRDIGTIRRDQSPFPARHPSYRPCSKQCFPVFRFGSMSPNLSTPISPVATVPVPAPDTSPPTTLITPAALPEIVQHNSRPGNLHNFQGGGRRRNGVPVVQLMELK